MGFSLLVFLISVSLVSSTRVKGSLQFNEEKQNYKNHFLTRFAIGSGHSAYVYGTVNRASDSDFIGYHSTLTLALLPQRDWDRFYHASQRDFGSSSKCHDLVMKTLNESIMIGDDSCIGNGTKDYLRTLPCTDIDGVYKSCNQPRDIPVFKGNDFTFHVNHANRMEYYYLFLFSCTRNYSTDQNCLWGSTDEIKIKYSFHLVNNQPNETNRFSNEFPYDLQGILPLQLSVFFLYIFLIGIHFLIHSRLCVERRYKMHVLVKIFSFSVVFELVYIFFELIHYSVYAGNGVGAVAMKYLAEISNQFSDWLLILVVILVGKGWQVTTSTLRWSKITVSIWGAYICFSAVYFIWMVVSSL